VTWQSEISTAPAPAVVAHCTRRTDGDAERNERSALPSGAATRSICRPAPHAA